MFLWKFLHLNQSLSLCLQFTHHLKMPLSQNEEGMRENAYSIYKIRVLYKTDPYNNIQDEREMDTMLRSKKSTTD